MDKKSNTNRTARILGQLQRSYPGKKAYDLDGRGRHFVCEVEPVSEHPDYDRAIEVIITTKAHLHHKMTQRYTVLKGTLTLHLNDETIVLKPKHTYTVKPGTVHWAESRDECWVEIYSEPGWTTTDHIVVP